MLKHDGYIYNKIKRLGVFATAEAIASMKQTHKAPIIAIKSGMPKSLQQHAYRLAIAHGLPDINVYDEYDLKNDVFSIVSE